MKKILILCAISMVTHAATLLEKEASLKEKMQDYLKSQNIVYLGDGVHIIKNNQLNLPKDLLKTHNKGVLEMAQNGYATSDNPTIYDLINLKKNVDNDLSSNDDSYQSTKWHKDYKNLKLSWNFITLPNSIKTLAYAPSNSFNGHWSGVVVALELDNKSYCMYEQIDIKTSHLSISIPESEVLKSINNKITTHWNYGNNEDGIVYQINWYDNDFSHELECLASTYSKDLLQYYIEQAKLIDSR